VPFALGYVQNHMRSAAVTAAGMTSKRTYILDVLIRAAIQLVNHRDKSYQPFSRYRLTRLNQAA
jgi:hypothetical protein